MKIKQLSLRNYKKFDSKVLDFCGGGDTPENMILLVGDNASGKSSILQAIALLVGGAVWPKFQPSELRYPGFRWDNIQKGRMPVQIDATICFTDDEINDTGRFCKELRERYPETYQNTPDSNPEISISLDYIDNKVKSPKHNHLLQMKGYQYALQLVKFKTGFEDYFRNVGSVYYYDEQRTASSIETAGLSGGDIENTRELIDEKVIKEVLFKWYVFHQQVASGKFILKEGQRDIFSVLEQRYQMLFHGRYLKGFAPKMSPDSFFETEQDFWLSDGKNDYEFSEMSGGERAIFPMLIDFANRNINNSIILIDELELHLHPPLQQALIRALPQLGENNQFIITSHSDSVCAMFAENQIIRL